jgi:glycerol-3-phosphate dehydrogenase
MARTLLDLDLLIVGGGVAGLWTLNRAVQAGYNAVLLEKGALGQGQSVHSQGIIHSGTKYALKGALTRAASAIAGMPARWSQCLKGEGELDLTGVRVASDATYLWSQGSLGARMTSFFASKALRGRVSDVAPADRPQIFRTKAFTGALYRVAEPVLDVPSLIATLAAPVAHRIRQLDSATLDYSFGADGIATITLPNADFAIRPTRIVLAAGEGFPAMALRLGLDRPVMQRRPLHMVAVEHTGAQPVFGHCIGTAPTPLVTVTTHPGASGRAVWYLGGGLAESGVAGEPAEQIATAQALLAQLLPGTVLKDPTWSTLRIDRAEPATGTLTRPDSGYAQAVGTVIAAWPTKLALAPDLADQILALLPPPRAGASDLTALTSLPAPPVARPYWESQ